ncbi:MAG: four helix bundle protein [Verrucomicrobiota bacterium]
MATQTFEDLDVWKRACQQAVAICRLVQKWTNFALRDQMTRCAVSVPSNIAEGYERDSDGDFRRFLRIAKGSNAELRTQLYIARELELISQEIIKSLVLESKEISAMLQGLIRAIERRLPSET